MAERTGGRAKAAVLPRFSFADPPGELRRALLEDVRELLSALKLSLARDLDLSDAIALGGFAAGLNDPLLLTFDDIPALPVFAVEGALEALHDAACVLGPCADGSVYLLGLAPGLEPGLLSEIAEVLLGPPEDNLESLTDLFSEDSLPVCLLPPWFRLASKLDLSFAENLAQLSLLAVDEDEDFLADRLRIWLERNQAASR